MPFDQLSGMSNDALLVAYANGIPVGVAPVNVEGTTLLVSWKSLYEYGLDTDGYRDGDEIEIRLFSQEYGQEFRVMADFNVDTYGESPITIGSIHVLDELAVPAEFGLSQNYPNPFDVNSTITFNTVVSGNASLVMTDMLGNTVAPLFNGFVNKNNEQTIQLNVNELNLNTGTYFITLRMGERVETRQISVVR